ncbi:MAG: hypothetical protein KJO82_13120 [Gammaproteobacteria bacterium]|nr:hypothetical protein [Gammaproteobacteria bacterium]
MMKTEDVPTLGKITRLSVLFVVAAAIALLGMPLNAEPAGDVETWQFDVYLDDKKVGYHNFEVVEQGGEKTVESQAEFNVKFLFVTAFRYNHRNVERWADNCLLEIEAKTRANGKRIEVEGERTDSGFRIVTDDEAQQLPNCVMSFAYWNPDFLDQSRLINPQSGEYLDVSIEQLDEEVLQIRGEAVNATPFKVTAKKVELTVWYSADDQWLALESVAKGGRILRYELA